MELCIAYRDLLWSKGRRREESWEGYNLWCGYMRCTATGILIAAPVVDGEVEKIAFTYADLSETVYCATAVCRGYSVPDVSSGAEIKDGVSLMYCYSICDRNNGFDAKMKTRNGLLRVVDIYWTQRHTKTTPSTTDDSTP